jgi:flagellar basal-body rod protein FlgB
MDATTIAALKALDGLAARATATAQNIANVNSPGYRPVKVEFEAMLRAAARQGPDAVASLAPRLTEMPSGAEVRLDQELADAADTAGRYSAVLELLGRRLALHSLAVGGRP